jgi:hypothetical protein
MTGVSFVIVIVVSTAFADIELTGKTKLLPIEDDPKFLTASDANIFIQFCFNSKYLSFFLLLFQNFFNFTETQII